jgi:hypothetical protein
VPSVIGAVFLSVLKDLDHTGLFYFDKIELDVDHGN